MSNHRRSGLARRRHPWSPWAVRCIPSFLPLVRRYYVRSANWDSPRSPTSSVERVESPDRGLVRALREYDPARRWVERRRRSGRRGHGGRRRDGTVDGRATSRGSVDMTQQTTDEALLVIGGDRWPGPRGPILYEPGPLRGGRAGSPVRLPGPGGRGHGRRPERPAGMGRPGLRRPAGMPADALRRAQEASTSDARRPPLTREHGKMRVEALFDLATTGGMLEALAPLMAEALEPAPGRPLHRASRGARGRRGGPALQLAGCRDGEQDPARPAGRQHGRGEDPAHLSGSGPPIGRRHRHRPAPRGAQLPERPEPGVRRRRRGPSRARHGVVHRRGRSRTVGSGRLRSPSAAGRAGARGERPGHRRPGPGARRPPGRPPARSRLRHLRAGAAWPSNACTFRPSGSATGATRWSRAFPHRRG